MASWSILFHYIWMGSPSAGMTACWASGLSCYSPKSAIFCLTSASLKCAGVAAAGGARCIPQCRCCPGPSLLWPQATTRHRGTMAKHGKLRTWLGHSMLRRSWASEGVCLLVKGDWAELVNSQGFPGWADKSAPCIFCKSSLENLYTTRGFTPTKQLLRRRPWTTTKRLAECARKLQS